MGLKTTAAWDLTRRWAQRGFHNLIVLHAIAIHMVYASLVFSIVLRMAYLEVNPSQAADREPPENSTPEAHHPTQSKQKQLNTIYIFIKMFCCNNRRFHTPTIFTQIDFKVRSRIVLRRWRLRIPGKGRLERRRHSRLHGGQ